MNTQKIEQLVFECGLQTPTVIVPAIILLLLCAWMLFRERHHLGGLWATAFWFLRALALAVLVWMFLQPARVTETKSTLPQSVAVIVDSSDSMKVVDPEGEGHSVSWQLANLQADDTSPRDVQVSLDSAMMAFEVAQSRWTAAQALLQEGRDASALKKRFEEVAFALTRAATQLNESFCEQWDDSGDQRLAHDFASQSTELAEFLADFDWKPFTEDFADKTAKQILRSHESLQTLVDLNRLVRTWSRSVSDSISQTLPDAEAVNRQAHVVQLIKETEQKTSFGAEAELSIKRFRFDEQLTPVVSADGWLGDQSNPEEFDEDFFEIDQLETDVAPSSTNLTAAIQQIVQLAGSQSIRSAVFLTDGAHNAADAVSPVEIAATRSQGNEIAISFVPIGSLKRPRDVQLYHVEHPRSVIRGDQIVIDALVSSNGFEGQAVNLQLRADDELIEEKALTIDADQIDLRHSFTVPTEQPGSIEFELKIEPVEGEISTTNNRAIFRVGVVRDKIRVMLADRISRWEYRYLDQLLYRDEHLEHEMILFDPRLRATGTLKEDAALPTTVEAWNQYEVALIGDLTPDQFPIESQESLVEFVKQKGGVAILVAGRSGMPHSFEDQPLASLLPVEKAEDSVSADKYQVGVNRLAVNLESIRLDESQPKSELLWRQVFEEQPITWLSEYSTPRPSARRLLDAIPADDDERLAATEMTETPAWVCWQQLGAGRVVFLSAPDTYRLRYRRGDRLHHRFWAQLLRWITSDDPGSDNGRVQLSTDKVRYQQDEAVHVTAFLSEISGEPMEGAQLEASFAGGDGETLTFLLAADETRPGRYAVKVEDLPAGAYRVGLTGDEIVELSDDGQSVETFVNIVTSPNVERVNTTCNRPLMKQIAQSSGGHVIPPTALAEWLTLQAGVPETTSQIERKPLWNRWSCLWVAFGCLVTEWFVRRVKGLT